MSLTWRTADLTLADKLIPNPNSESQLLDRLSNVRVAVDAGFLHIDARPNGQPAYPGQTEYAVHIVPAHLVRTVVYKAHAAQEPEPIEVQVY